jgi:maltodextrin utilization protein YvdJ
VHFPFSKHSPFPEQLLGHILILQVSPENLLLSHKQFPFLQTPLLLQLSLQSNSLQSIPVQPGSQATFPLESITP